VPEQAIRHEAQEFPSLPQVTVRPDLSGEPNGGFNPSFSPDGSMIAFLSSTLHTPHDLWIMKTDGTGAKRLTTKGVKDFRWSPDGKSIMITVNRKGFEETLVIGIEAESAEKRITGLVPGASIPAYSPDGELFAFTAPNEKKVRDLWIGTADGERIEAVTEKISVRNVFWSPDSRKIYYEVGKDYGVGIWEMDLATMESKSILSKYIGTPGYSEKANLIAFAYPTNPGEFEIRTMKLDGSDIKNYVSPRLPGRWISWDTDGKGVYYLGQDIEEIHATEASDESAKGPPEKTAADGLEKPPMHPTSKKPDFKRAGVTSLWHLDFETGAERRLSPENLHLTGFSLYSDGTKMVLVGVTEKSYAAEMFSFDMASEEVVQLTESRVSSWMAVPSRDSSKIAYFTNEGFIDTLKVVGFEGEELASYPGILQEGDMKVSWLPDSEGMMIFSGRGLFAFTEKGPIEFPNRVDHRVFFYADVSLQGDKVLLNSIPRFGETPGLYTLEIKEGKFLQTDLRYPQNPEDVPELYFQPRWSFDGRKIAFTDRVDIWTMKAEGTGRTRITTFAENNLNETGKPSLASYPVWSVNGEMICYTLTVYDEKEVIRQIWVMNADGSEGRMLFSEELDSQFQAYQAEYTNQPFFDATDERVIYTAVTNGIPDIFSVGIRDGKVQRLTEHGAIYPSLFPEEGVVIYTSLEGNNETLWIMNSDGTDKRRFIITGAEENK